MGTKNRTREYGGGYGLFGIDPFVYFCVGTKNRTREDGGGYGLFE